MNWQLAEKNKDFLRFMREVIWLRKRHPALRRRRFFVGEFRARQYLLPQPLPQGGRC